MDNEKSIIHKRNALLIKIMIVGVVFDIITNVLAETSLFIVLFIFFTFLIGIGISIYFHYKKIFVKTTMFLLATLINFVVVMVSFAEADLVNTLFLFLIPIIVCLYPSWKVIMYATITSCSSFVWMALKHGKEMMGSNFIPSDVYYYVVIFAIMGFFVIMQAKFSEGLRLQAESKASEATISQKETEVVLKQITDNADLLNSFSHSLQQKSAATTSSGEHVAIGFEQMSKATDEQMTSIQELYGHIEKIVEETKRINDSSNAMKEKSDLSKTIIDDSNSYVESLKSSMNQLNKTFQENMLIHHELNENASSIETVIATMENITSQIHLLSLNARIEAARAGDSGRGFAIVAEEIRKLAEESSQSTNEISAIVGKVQEKTKQSATSMEFSKDAVHVAEETSEKVGRAFDNITENNRNVADEIDQINQRIQELQALTTVIHSNISSITAVSEQNGSSLAQLSFNFMEIIDMLKQLTKDFDELQEKTKLT